MKISHILGINARTRLFSYPNNPREGKRIARSKIITHRVLKKAQIPAPMIFKKFKKPEDVIDYRWEKLPDSFVLKPSRGLGGEGIVVIKKRSKDKKYWVTTDRKKMSVDDFKLHTLDILEGAYSMGNVPDVAFVQEYVGRHRIFRKFAYRGTPDIRVIIFNKVPVMAMLRLPTKESGGRANLHQGAIGVGVDIATGITTHAIWHGNEIYQKPNSNTKLSGIRIPFWDRILAMAISCQQVSGLGYLGVDIILHPEKGPMVLELNDQPGLQIQLANIAGLRKRLERVEDLAVVDADHGVSVAKALFSSNQLISKATVEKGIRKILGHIEPVSIYSGGKIIQVKARIDSGAVRSSIDRKLADKLGLMHPDNILWEHRYRYRSASGIQSRPVVGITLKLSGRKMRTSASVTDRSKQTTPMLIGRNDLTGFLINPD